MIMYKLILCFALLFCCHIRAATAWPFQCFPTSNWPGWPGIKYAFVFGDSYTTTSFNVTGTQPSAGNPLGNPPYPGFTATDGPTWTDYLTVKYNKSLLLTYNLAFGGATVDSALVAPFLPIVLSLDQQITQEFMPLYAGSPSIAPWKSDDAIFAIFIGINDVGNSYGEGTAATNVLNPKIFAVYHGLVDMLYFAGARNFLFLNVPPVDRSPLTTGQGTSAVALEKADIAEFNDGISEMTWELKKTYQDSNVFLINTNHIFSEVLDNPKSFPQTAGYKNTTAYCNAYMNGTPTMTYYDPSCGVPVNQYFWLNSLHPTYPMMDALTDQIAKQLMSGPNVC